MPTLTDWVATFAQELAQRIGEKRYRLWFAQQTRFSWQDEQLVIGVPNRFFLEWLQATFGQTVQAVAEHVAGHPVCVRFVIDAALFQAHRASSEATGQTAQADRQSRESNQHLNDSSADAGCKSNGYCEASNFSEEGSGASGNVQPAPDQSHGGAQPIRPGNKLDRFLVGESNRLAYAAIQQLLETLGKGPPWFATDTRPLGLPLTLYGPHGVGKSHLLEGVAELLTARFGSTRVACLTAEDFTNQFLQAMRQGKLVEFRRRFRSLQVLLLDDLQFLEGKRATQEELLHTLETLTRTRRVFVTTCDRHPRMGRWLPELTDRLLGGAVWPVELPDLDLRCRLLAAKAEQLGCPFPPDALYYIASTVQGNVRELEGALYAVYHYALVQQQPVTQELAQAALTRWLRPACRQVTLREVERAVNRILRLRPGVLRGREKVRSASYPRMIALYLARKYTGLPYGEIGRYFGGRNHSTVIAAERKVATWLRDNVTLQLGGFTWRIAELVQHIERDL